MTEAPFHFRFDRAVTKSDLPTPVRHLLMVINIKTDRSGRIPDEFQPSYTELAASMGSSTRGVKNWVAMAEDAGWLIVTRPSTYASQIEHARNKYQPVLPSGASEPGSPGDATNPLGHHPVNEVHLPGESDARDLVNDVHTIQNTSDLFHSAAQPLSPIPSSAPIRSSVSAEQARVEARQNIREARMLWQADRRSR